MARAAGRLGGRFCMRRQAPVAQLDRAPDYESGGQEFESLRARQDLTPASRARIICLLRFLQGSSSAGPHTLGVQTPNRFSGCLRSGPSVSRQAHNLKVVGSNPTPATNRKTRNVNALAGFFMRCFGQIRAFCHHLRNAMWIKHFSSRVMLYRRVHVTWLAHGKRRFVRSVFVVRAGWGHALCSPLTRARNARVLASK